MKDADEVLPMRDLGPTPMILPDGSPDAEGCQQLRMVMEYYGVNTPMVAMIGGTLSYEFGLGGETPGIVQTELISVFCCILPIGCHNCRLRLYYVWFTRIRPRAKC